MKRSNAPFFWLLFGAGGMLSALSASVLVWVSGIAVPLGLGLHADALNYAHVLAFAQSWVGKLALLAVIALYAWHAAHRIYHSLHDVGIPHGPLSKLLCYGSAFAMTLVACVCLLML